MSIALICPICKCVLSRDLFNLNIDEDLLCENCKTRFKNRDGCFKFTSKTQEEIYYEEKYSRNFLLKKENINFQKIREMWFDPFYPDRKIFIKKLGSIKNKVILLLGNGESVKELYFLKSGNIVIYSDISLNAVQKIKNEFNWGKHQGKIAFHAIDAYNIPLNAEAIDIVIGYDFVHHLDNLDLFFNEIQRILKPGGKCLFLDDAYSSIWQNLKFNIFRPLVEFSHNKWGMSPEDLRATKRGGYHWKEIEEIKLKYNFSGMAFVRFGFLYHIFSRGVGKIFGYHKIVENIKRKFIPVLFCIDNYLQIHSRFYHDNTFLLVWGFKK